MAFATAPLLSLARWKSVLIPRIFCSGDFLAKIAYFPRGPIVHQRAIQKGDYKVGIIEMSDYAFVLQVHADTGSNHP